MAQYEFMNLPDGRKLSWLEFGDKNGHPVFYFHGAPSSCMEPMLIGNETFAKHGLRIISPNRPGIAQSDFQNNRSFKDWPNDVIGLADHLNIQKFSVFGNSGGGAYVLACAASIPQRLHSAVVMSGGWQMNHPEVKKNLKFPISMFWFMARNLSFLLPFLLGTMKNDPKTPRDKALAQAKKMMPPPDYEAISQNDRLEVLGQTINEAIANKKGAAYDLKLYLKKFDFELAGTNFPITYFHGEQDRNMPIEMVRKMTAELPNARLITFKDDAHLSTLTDHFEEAVAAIKRST